MCQLNFIDGKDVTIQPDEDGHIILRYSNGVKKTGVKPRRLFTITTPTTYIRMLNKKGREIAILRDMDKLDRNSRKHLEEALERFYVVPRINEIKALKEEYGVMQWDVMTDRGQRAFYVRSRNTDIHVLAPRRVIIRDADNNRYEIPDYNKLSKHSRQLLEGEI